MNDEEQRRSMDDVLSSIRRIMRPGSGGSAAPAAQAAPDAARPADAAPDPGPAAADAPDPAPTEPVAGIAEAREPEEFEDDDPLPLTDMIAEEAAGAAPPEEAAEAGPGAGEEAAGEERWPAAALDDPAGEPAAEGHWPGMADPETPRPAPFAPPQWEPTDEDDDADGARAAAGDAEDDAPDMAEEPAPAGTSLAVQEEGERALMIDEGALEDMIRRVVRSELVEGEIGRNISENVRRLIAAEVAKALRDRD